MHYGASGAMRVNIGEAVCPTWFVRLTKRPRTRTTTRTRTIGEAEGGNQDPRWRVPAASKRSINRVNIATTRVWFFLLASSASPIVLVLVVVLVLDLFAFARALKNSQAFGARTVYPSLMVVKHRDSRA